MTPNSSPLFMLYYFAIPDVRVSKYCYIIYISCFVQKPGKLWELDLGTSARKESDLYYVVVSLVMFITPLKSIDFVSTE